MPLAIGLVLLFVLVWVPEGTCSPSDSPGTVVDPSTLRVDASSEASYQQRISALLDAQTWKYGSGAGDTDVGKRDWPAFLAELYKVKNNSSAAQSLIDGDGLRLLQSESAGSFYKAFSCPGFSLFYFAWQDRLSSTHHDAVRATLDTKKGKATAETGWQCLMREDRHMDPIYSVTEKNSENFSWMSRMAGVLFSHEFGSKHQSYFDGFMDNLTRATFSTGRVEWDSNNYFGYCVQPLLVLYEYAPNEKVKRQARALLDWMCITSALHYLDGALVGPDIRAKGNDYLPFSGSFWPYGYAWFGGQAPSFGVADVKANMSRNLAGWLNYSSYRPPRVAVDIAHRKFTGPVEMHNAKPFYHLDFDNYADWDGSTDRSRRFEFETLYLSDNYTLGSVASNVPDGRHPNHGGIGCFSEERLWMLGVKGRKGAYKVHGKSGAGSISGENAIQNYWGRNPYEEIGQYKNVIMRLLKGTDLAWVVIPSACNPHKEGSRVFADMGSDVYLAITPWNGSGLSLGSLKGDDANTVCKWSFAKNSLGALVLEVGTKREHGSFAEFKNAITGATTLQSPGTDKLIYRSTLGRELAMEFVSPGSSYSYWDKTPSPVVHPVAGTLPRVWRDGAEVDFSSWDSYRVVEGEPIVNQQWGSGTMSCFADNKGMAIVVDPQTADVEWRRLDDAVSVRDQKNAVSGGEWPHPRGLQQLMADRRSLSAEICDLSGRVLRRYGGRHAGPASSLHLPPGLYLYRTQDSAGRIQSGHLFHLGKNPPR